MKSLKHYFLICVALLGIASCSSQTRREDTVGLIPVGQNGKFGYMDKTGKIVINPQFDSAHYFSEGLALVQMGERFGYIDKEGKYVVNPQFKGAIPFSEGLAAIITDNGLGYIDKTGKVVITPQFRIFGGKEGVGEWLHSFSEGLAAVIVGDKWGYIDKTGKIVFEPRFDGNNFDNPFKMGGGFEREAETIGYDLRRLTFAEGAVVQVGDDMSGYKSGYINKTGKYVLGPKFTIAYPFHGGLALVSDSHDVGYIDKTGTFIWKRSLNP